MKYFLSLLAIVIFVGCSGGLEPKPITFLKGTIYYSDNQSWPPADSLLDLRLVALKNFPPSDIVTEILGGNAYFTETLPFYVDSTHFEIEISDAPVELKYIAVAQNFDGFLDWKVVGVFSENNDNKHTNLYMDAGIDKQITIFVDFNNIPEQPFEVE